MDERIRVLLADDHPLVRSGIRAVLAEEPGIEIVGEAGSGEALIALVLAEEADVLLLDHAMPGPPAAELIAFTHEHRPGLRVLMLSASAAEGVVRAMVAAGIEGYVLKSEAVEQVATAIRAVHRGETWFSQPVVTQLLPRRSAARGDDGLPLLTEREEAILRCIGRGWENGRIASELHLAEQTVRNYTSRLYRKLGLASRGEAVVWAREHGLV